MSRASIQTCTNRSSITVISQVRNIDNDIGLDIYIGIDIRN